MSALINRVPTGRIASLHAELQYLQWRFGQKTFSLVEMKLDPTLKKTQLDFYVLAKHDPKWGNYNGKYDPFLRNRLDKAGFHLTQSTVRDTQKSKSVSECFNALEALGWIERVPSGQGKITTLGTRVAKLDYRSPSFLPLLRSSLLAYGPFVGFLAEAIRTQKGGTFKRSSIFIGYPKTGETIKVGSERIPLSVGSQADSVTRTRSTLAAWAMTAGFLWPKGVPYPKNKKLWHSGVLPVLQGKWSWTSFDLLVPLTFLKDTTITVTRPLDYGAMTKSTKALRERGQAGIRSATIGVESLVKNRRFAIVYVLASASVLGQSVSIAALIAQLGKYPKLFVVEKKDFRHVLLQELPIAHTAGVPYFQQGDCLTPLVVCSPDAVSKGAPTEVVTAIKGMLSSVLL